MEQGSHLKIVCGGPIFTQTGQVYTTLPLPHDQKHLNQICIIKYHPPKQKHILDFYKWKEHLEWSGGLHLFICVQANIYSDRTGVNHTATATSTVTFVATAISCT
jgi:hypothetical protein